MEHTSRPSEPVSDEELASNLQAVRNFVVHYLRRKGNSIDIAEEAADEGIARACQVASQWEGKRKATLRTYLVSVARNKAIDFLRKEASLEKYRQHLLWEHAARRKRLRHGQRKKISGD